ncbi:MAG: hypothetical protein ACI9UO_002308 [Nitrospinales bacterium]|jgi:hypothetical protein
MGIAERGSDGLIGSRLRSWRKTIPFKSFQLADVKGRVKMYQCGGVKVYHSG